MSSFLYDTLLYTVIIFTVIACIITFEPKLINSHKLLYVLRACMAIIFILSIICRVVGVDTHAISCSDIVDGVSMV